MPGSIDAMLATDAQPGQAEHNTMKDLNLSSEFTRFCELSEIPAGSKKALKINDSWVLVCHTNKGLYAVSGICSHQAKPLFNGRVRNCKITCPVHGARFDLETGEPLDLPATQPIPTYEVRVIGDWIEVCL